MSLLNKNAGVNIMKLSSLTPVAAVLAVAVTTPVQADTNPFMAKPVSTMTVAMHTPEHEGKCGGMTNDKAKEGKCGSSMKTDAKTKEGKCGEGKCGGKMKNPPADTNKDGNVSKEEFMTHHEQMFTDADTNKDGMLNMDERNGLHKTMMKEGKCGEGKCGGAKKATTKTMKEGKCGSSKTGEGSCGANK